ncbi:hypothetical protein MIR68_007904 [Amoeboaphelidium protococcarum]|nr:hypothetical protein MIR68_007904 [Amoeboaphelidium protococcarum]
MRSNICDQTIVEVESIERSGVIQPTRIKRLSIRSLRRFTKFTSYFKIICEHCLAEFGRLKKRTDRIDVRLHGYFYALMIGVVCCFAQLAYFMLWQSLFAANLGAIWPADTGLVLVVIILIVDRSRYRMELHYDDAEKQRLIRENTSKRLVIALFFLFSALLIRTVVWNPFVSSLCICLTKTWIVYMFALSLLWASSRYSTAQQGTVLAERRIAFVFVASSIISGLAVVGACAGWQLYFEPEKYYEQYDLTVYTVKLAASYFVGVFLFAPLALTVKATNLNKLWRRRLRVIAVLCIITTIVVIEIIIPPLLINTTLFYGDTVNYLAHFLCFPLVIACGLLIGHLGYKLSNCVLGCSGLYVILRSADSGTQEQLDQVMLKVIKLMIFVLVIFFTALAFAAIQMEKRKAYQETLIAKQQAELSNLQKTRFMSFLCHELRNPLHAILNMVEFIHDETDINTDNNSNSDVESRTVVKYEDFKSMTQAIKVSTEYMSNLINDVLDSGKFESGKVQLDSIPTDVRELSQKIVKPIVEQLKLKGVEFDLRIADGLPAHILIDPTRFQQILLNMLSNAAKFTQSGGQIVCSLTSVASSLSQSSPGHYIDFIVQVRDTGIGMSQEEVDGLFQPYAQASVSTSRVFGGSGLGLSIVKQIVDLMHGTIDVQSQVGKGSTFTITIPVEYCLLNKANNPQSTESLQKSSDSHLSNDFGTQISQNKAILVVDDSQINRAIIVRMLKSIEFTNITEADNGRSAVDLIKQGAHYDLVLMDIQMPVMTGFEAIELIRNELGLGKSDLPVVAITANLVNQNHNDQYEIDSLAAFNDVYGKPFKKDQLVHILQKYDLFSKN